MDKNVEMLPVRLGTEEKELKSKEQSSKILELQKVQEHRKDVTAGFRQKEELLHGEILELAHTISSGEERRPVEVVWKANSMESVMEVYRTDTGERVRARPMTDVEKANAIQPSMFGGRTGQES